MYSSTLLSSKKVYFIADVPIFMARNVRVIIYYLLQFEYPFSLPKFNNIYISTYTTTTDTITAIFSSNISTCYL